MSIITRSEAKAAKIGKYFTGKPCSAGHVAERYTQSGTCVECVIASTLASRPVKNAETAARREARVAQRQQENAEAVAVIRAERQAYDQALAELVEIKVRSYPGDLATLKELAGAMGQTHYPMLGADKFGQVGKPTDLAGGTALYRFRVAAADIDLIRETAAALLNAHRVDVTSVRDAVIRQAEAMADEAATPAPEVCK